MSEGMGLAPDGVNVRDLADPVAVRRAQDARLDSRMIVVETESHTVLLDEARSRWTRATIIPGVGEERDGLDGTPTRLDVASPNAEIGQEWSPLLRGTGWVADDPETLTVRDLGEVISIREVTL